VCDERLFKMKVKWLIPNDFWGSISKKENYVTCIKQINN